GTFAKTLFPALRIGYLVADQPVAGAPSGVLLAHELAKVKGIISVNTSPLLQAMVGGLLLANDFTLVDANRDKRRHYQANRDRMRRRRPAAVRVRHLARDDGGADRGAGAMMTGFQRSRRRRLARRKEGVRT